MVVLIFLKSWDGSWNEEEEIFFSEMYDDNSAYLMRKFLKKWGMDDIPDLSHLTPEERAIIENVMHRQKQEEEKENEIMR